MLPRLSLRSAEVPGVPRQARGHAGARSRRAAQERRHFRVAFLLRKVDRGLAELVRGAKGRAAREEGLARTPRFPRPRVSKFTEPRQKSKPISFNIFSRTKKDLIRVDHICDSLGKMISGGDRMTCCSTFFSTKYFLF